MAPRGQRAVGMRQWRRPGGWGGGGPWSQVGESTRFHSGSPLLGTLASRPCAQGGRKRHIPENEGRPAKWRVTQEAGKARATAELGHWRGLTVT